MPEKRRKFDRGFCEGAVRIVRETNEPIAQVAADLGIHAGTLANWVKQDKINRGEAERLSGDERAELARLRAENAELRMELTVLKRSVVTDRWQHRHRAPALDSLHGAYGDR
jgi:transposase